MEIVTEKVEVVTAGEAGAAIGSKKSRAMNGFLLDIKLDYHASAPATTDVTITDVDGNTILTVSDSKTDGLFAPRQKLVDNAKADITNSHDRFAVNGTLNFAIAQCDALNPALTATIRYLRL